MRAVRAVVMVLGVPLALTALASVLTVTGGSPVSCPLPAGAERADAQLQRALAEFVAERPLVPGAALSVTAPGIAYTGAAGRRSLLGRPPDAATPFRTASVTKTFTAAGVLRLAETGRLGLDDPISVHLPHRLVERLPAGDRITVRQLLDHTSGLYDYGTDPTWMARVAVSPRRVWQPLELIDQALAHGQPYGRPGERWHYSDTGYVLLALILERVTEQPLAGAYRSLLPMEELSATYLEGREPAPPHARQHGPQYAGPLPLSRHDPSYDNFGGGGLVSTVADLDAFTRALFGGRVFRDPRTLTSMLQMVQDGDDGYGLGIGRRRIAGEQVWLHTGFSGAVLAYVPRLQTSVAATTNQTLARPEPLLAAVLESLRAAQTLKPIARSSSLASSEIMSVDHGGENTKSTSTLSTPGRAVSTSVHCWWMISVSGQPIEVSVMRTSTWPSPLSSSYTRPRSTMLIPISGSTTAFNAFRRSSSAGIPSASRAIWKPVPSCSSVGQPRIVSALTSTPPRRSRRAGARPRRTCGSRRAMPSSRAART